MAEKKKFPVFMDVRIRAPPYQRMVFELLYDVAPFTAENFRALCPGEKGVSPKTKRPLGYKHCFFLTVNEGDSYVKLKHDKEGLLSMSRRDQEASCSHFVLTLKADQSLASSHVIFGKIVEGLGKLREIRDYNFFMLFRIINCGVSYNARDILTDVIIKPCPPYAVSCEGEQNEDRAREEGPSSSKPKGHKIHHLTRRSH